jgi:hypothetical protein
LDRLFDADRAALLTEKSPIVLVFGRRQQRDIPHAQGAGVLPFSPATSPSA